MRLVRLAVFASIVIAAACRDQSTRATQVQPDCSLQGPTVAPPFATLHPGDTLRAKVGFAPCPAGLTPAFQWRSSDTAVALVDSITGLVTAHSPGDATVLAVAVVNPAIEGAMALQVTPR